MAKAIGSSGHEALCRALTDARIGAGQAQLAGRLHCHQSLVARIESGEHRVDVIELVVLARAIGVSASTMSTVVETETPEDHRI